MRELAYKTALSWMFFLYLILFSCAKENISETPVFSKELIYAYELKLKQYDNQWLDLEFCDAMLWTGLADSSPGYNVDLRESEYENEPGRFNRRPKPFCEAGLGSKTSWSRDMAMGLIFSSWRDGDLELLERHAKYGVKKNWKMGEPFADGRVQYTPNILRLLYQTIYKLGGEDNVARAIPAIYASGLDGYEAHLQTLDYILTMELFGSVPRDGERVIKKHVEREPECPIFSYAAHIDDGDQAATIEILLADNIDCSFLSSNDARLASWLFTAGSIIKHGRIVD